MGTWNEVELFQAVFFFDLTFVNGEGTARFPFLKFVVRDSSLSASLLLSSSSFSLPP